MVRSGRSSYLNNKRHVGQLYDYLQVIVDLLPKTFKVLKVLDLSECVHYCAVWQLFLNWFYAIYASFMDFSIILIWFFLLLDCARLNRKVRVGTLPLFEQLISYCD